MLCCALLEVIFCGIVSSVCLCFFSLFSSFISFQTLWVILYFGGDGILLWIIKRNEIGSVQYASRFWQWKTCLHWLLFNKHFFNFIVFFFFCSKFLFLVLPIWFEKKKCLIYELSVAKRIIISFTCFVTFTINYERITCHKNVYIYGYKCKWYKHNEF